MSADRTARDPLVVGMTRPLLVLGVTYSYFIVEGMAVTVLFLMGNSLAYLLLILPLHAAGALLCKWEPRFFDILLRTAQNARPVPNRPRYRCNVYVPR